VIVVGPATRWITFPFEDDDIVYFIEIGHADGEDGWPIRQVELEGPERVPIAAAALSEWPEEGPGATEKRNAYVARYGSCGDKPMPSDWPAEDLSPAEFEEVWRHARSYLDERRG
jgi:hypothetical protein